MTEESNVVRPDQILEKAKASATTSQLSAAIQRQITPPGTAPAKARLGYVTAFDPATWTCTALIGDLLTPIPNIAVLGHLYPPVESAAMFLQTGGSSTTEYILIGTMPKDSGTPTYGQTWRIRKPADESISNSGTPAHSDADLKFYGQAGRTYLYEGMLIVCQNTSADMDIRVGWNLPSGALYWGGGPGAIATIAASNDGNQSTGAGANWRSVWATSSSLPIFGVEVSTGPGVLGHSSVLMLHGSIKMGSTSGWCNVAWCQNVPATANTTVREGSYLKVDMTSEYTL